MRILSFEIQDADGWTLEPMKLDAFNLLVGVSGAGKTRIVRAIDRVCAVALGVYLEDMRGARFAIDFEHDGIDYGWEAELDVDHDQPFVRRELIIRHGQELVERTAERFLVEGHEIPRIDRAKSAIATLKEDPQFAPLHAAFSRCVVDALNEMSPHGNPRAIVEQHSRYASVEALGADFSLGLHDKAELLKELFPKAFAEIKDAFRDAFPSVVDLGFGRRYIPGVAAPGREAKPQVLSYLAADEVGINKPVEFRAMSSGMQRYLAFLVHLTFAPRGTVVLVDELESSFGINCLPAATRFLLRRAPDLQLILTSHHPYIIEHIPTDCWKIVTRKGSRVRVLDASAIPALEEKRSHLDRFTRLVNLPEYEQGIQA